MVFKDESSWKGREFLETKYFQPRDTEHHPKVLFIDFYQSELKTGLDMIFIISLVNQQVGTQKENQISHREEKGITNFLCKSYIYHFATDAHEQLFYFPTC